MTIALVRPEDWNFPLLVHVAGAMLLVGSLVTVAALLLLAWRADSPGLIRIGFRTLLLAALPSYVLMRVGAEWINSKENIPDGVGWISAGYITADVGLLLLLISTILAGLAARKSRRAPGSGGTLGRVATVLTLVLVVGYVVAVWAMTTKPS
ncbi:MAG TPA: hypothetical protein VES61_08395 [Gaiellaceae bacterium]|nr:hypothetical protein [Gaiellaceae bacterium]